MDLISPFLTGGTKMPCRPRDCRQITFVTLNGFCPLSYPAPLLPPSPPSTVLNGQYQNRRIPTKIKCKIYAPFVLTKFYKTSSPNLDYLVP